VKTKLSMLRQVSMKLTPMAGGQAQSLAAKLGLSAVVSNTTTDDVSSFLNPQEEDFIYVPVRMLSAAEVQGKTINFAHNNGQALRDAVGKFNDIPIMKNHNFVVEDCIGRTQECFWDETTPGAPMGVTGMMRVDSKMDPKTARGLITGLLDSVSVTVQFDFEKSHPNLKDDEFFWKLGEEVEGKTVQALVTEVTRLYELSVVWQGADTHAKTIQDGTIKSPGLSQQLPTPHLKEETPMDLTKLLAKLGLTGEQTPEQLETALDAAISAATAAGAQSLEAKVTSLTEQVAVLNTEKSGLSAANDSLKLEIEKLRPQATLGETFLADQRKEAKRLYEIVAGATKDPAMLALIEGASLEVSKGFITTFEPQAEAIAPLTCTSCGGKHLTRKASKDQNVTLDKDYVSTATAKAHAATVNRMVGAPTK
jgi:hypothetical protein